MIHCRVEVLIIVRRSDENDFGRRRHSVHGFDVDALVPLANEVGPTVADVQVPLSPEDEAKIPKRV